MSTRAAPSHGLPGRVALIVAASALMCAAIFIADREVARRALAAEEEPEIRIVADGEPIPAEAGVFHATVAQEELSLTRRSAHLRTLGTFRALRAYPGAPPSIPHGLTAEELRTTSCRNCHERGGFVPRFGAYAPVTPHPEYTQCLQCHLVDDALAGTQLPLPVANAGCRQCHAVDGKTPLRVEIEWRPSQWPTLAARDGSPPAIPHELQLRGNCIACHAGPAAVAEIRTTHPERTSCRQCHLEATYDVEPFTRPAAGGER